MINSHIFSRTREKRPIILKGEGIYLWDDNGTRFIDGSGGPCVVGIGHGVREIQEAIISQMKKVSYVHSLHFSTNIVEKFAEKIANFAPGSLKRVFPVSGGSEATETAIKMARQYHLERGNQLKYKVISRWKSYHGNSLGALSASGHISRRAHYIPLLIDFPHIPPAYCYRCPFFKDPDTCDLECAYELEYAIKREGEKHISSFIAEPIVGSTLGTVPAPEGYFQIIREICDKYDILLIVDEVQTGFGRTGKNFGIEHWDVEPDIIISAKGASSGYLPLGVVIATEKIYNSFNKPFGHGFTFGSHPLSCAVGVSVIEYIEKHDLVSRSAKLGDYLMKKLTTIYEHPSVGDVRGKGLFAGIEFVKNKKLRQPFDFEIKYNQKIIERCYSNKLLLYSGSGGVDGYKGDHIQIAPPLTISKDQIDEIIKLLDMSIGEVERDYNTSIT